MSLVKRITIDGTSYDIAPANMDSVPTADSENPISSGGIKSYLESSYVPLSATQAPVTGLTDILTPVNLLPNSDFSRSGGYPNTQTVVTLYAYLNLAQALRLDCQASSITNATITRSTGSINIQGTAGNIGDHNRIIPSLSTVPNIVKSGKTYTLIMNGSSSTHNISFFPRSVSTYTLVYRDSNVTILTPASDQNVQFNIEINNVSANDNIDVTFNTCAVYEGEFKNPPITTGLDVKPGNQFLLADRSNYKTYLSCLTGFEGTINTHKRSDDIYEDVFSLGISQNTGGAFHDCIHVKMIAFIHSAYSYHMSITEFDISLMQYGTYGIPDATILNKNIQDITHTNQSGTGSSHICIKLDDIKILRDPTNDRILKLQAKVLNSLTTNWDNSREATAHISVETNAFGYNNAVPKILLNSYTVYYGQYNNVY